ncbi:MAG TPA: methyl-accepting chemotaxis protein, partial [Gemmatimonadaceae bacterium]|nr:methyl-accepting chemotaxis protein [Gemmatimonadaceae bacterium]
MPPKLAELPKTQRTSANGNGSHAPTRVAPAIAPAKTNRVAAVVAPTEGTERREAAKRSADQKKRARTAAKQQQLAERLAGATQQLGSGVTEAASSVRELATAVDQISGAAQEASSATEESVAAITQIEKSAELAAREAQGSLDKVDRAQELVRATTADIDQLIVGVREAADTNIRSAKMVAELEQLAEEVNSIVQTVAGIAKQTNLLALNAAIEAARAGEHGRGFAVVADEVRNLAETSEKSAREIRDLVQSIKQEVGVVAKDVEQAGTAAAAQVDKAAKITTDLQQIAGDMVVVQVGAKEINDQAGEAATAALQFKRGSEQVAKAAEEQARAVEEASKTIEEQNKALADLNAASDELSQMADTLESSSAVDKSAEELASAAEELSATIEQSSRAAREIATAVQQIATAGAEQAAATEESASAAEQIEKGATVMKERADVSIAKAGELQRFIAANKLEIDALITGISGAAEASARSAENIRSLEASTGRIDKIVDAIVMVSMQTNLLAVNGGIEAARAGEYGRGFAVVAGDVRSLAKDSAENAEKIKDLVKRVQQQVAKVATDIEQTGVKARQ